MVQPEKNPLEHWTGSVKSATCVTTSWNGAEAEEESFLKQGSGIWPISAWFNVYRLLALDLSQKPLCRVPTENANLSVEIRIENYRLQDPSGFQIGFGKLDHVEAPRMVQ